MSFFASWPDFQAWLDARGLFHMELGLGRMRRALAVLAPGKSPFPIIQVLGTNGKGSTCAFLDAMARARGLKTGLFTSPHFLSVKERILVNGRKAEEAEWLAAANDIMDAGDFGLTYFEFLTVLAALLFRRAKVDLAIFEAGLGGANDATSALGASLHCFAPIAMDHAEVIGPGLADIARDKAAAINPGADLLSAPQFPLARAVLAAASAAKGAKLEFARPLAKDLPLGLPGKHQKTNAALALAAFRKFAALADVAFDEEKARAGLGKTFLPGRLQIIPDEKGSLVLDGAHNPHGMACLVENLAGMREKPAAIIYSALADKDWKPALAMLARLNPQAPFFIPGLDNPRALDPAEAAAFHNSRHAGGALALGGPGALARALGLAAAKAGAAPVLLTGSLYLLSEFFSLRPRCLQRPSEGEFKHEADL